METKLKIIRTALRLFLQKGIDKTSMNEIAKSIGITKPAIYYHFENKEAVIIGVLELFKKEMRNWTIELHKSDSSIKDYIEKIFQSIKIFSDVTVILLGEIPEECIYNFDELISQFSKKNFLVKNEMENIFVQTRKSISEKIIEGQSANQIKKNLDPKLIALQIHTIVEGINYIAQLDSTVDLTTIGQKLFNEFWELIKQ
ncbi:MAG: TetR/AcrR family transcriptional regulator [Candidatus Cloacimonetes bacterium]|jgi:AcrR family transcriptional regulator|nr:TetR/AcrR family transcriptional regulator [Candidatus Cloacimonadota bacterium]